MAALAAMEALLGKAKKDQEELEARIQKMREEHAMKDKMKELEVRLDAASFLLVGVFVRAWQGH